MTEDLRAPGTAEVPVPLSGPLCAPAHRQHILWAAVLASSMGFIDSTVTAIAMPAIRASLGADLQAAQWIHAAYMLTLSALILAGGAMGDRFGTARVFVTGIVLFMLSSLVCAMAPSAGWMVGARALQGVAAALMVPGSMAMIGRAFPREERGRAYGFWTAAATATTASGPLLGGLLLGLEADWAWRLIFAINLPIGLLALWLLRGRLLPDQSARSGAAVDWPGATLATLALGLIAWSLTEGGVWPITAGLALLLVFVLWERKAPTPMLRLSLFHSASFSATNLATLLLYIAISGISFYLPMHAIPALGLSELQMALSYLPISVTIALFSAPAGRLADRIGAMPLMAAGSALVALAQLGMGLTIHWAAHWSVTVPFIALSGFGLAVLVAPLTAAVMQAAREDEQGAASGINNMVARAGGLLAVALFGGVAARAYGAIGPESPGFGIASANEGHFAASAHGFAAVAFSCAGLAASAALVSVLWIRRPN